MFAAILPGQERMRVARRLRLAAMMIAPMLLHAPQADAQQVDSAAFRGRVVRESDAAPVAGAGVSFPSLGLQSTTDSAGAFRFARVPVGLHALQIRRIGYEKREDTLTVVAGGENSRTYRLRQQAPVLDTVHTMAGKPRYLSPMLRAFEERRLSHAGGYFISDSVFRQNESSTLTNILLSRMPGVTAVYVNSNRALVSARKPCRGLGFRSCNGKPDCFVAVYVDGVLYFNAKMAAQGVQPPDMEKEFNPGNFAGAEYYAGGASAPIGMHVDDDGCGSLWLWTRER